ncbi:hypothetical protein F511_10366 [Dorcoceras hygrometricum]|uniref:Uncharacterized protein n=1 Tax=Dorcoceras hygrometricum TaxID=472368 RepID=A0A2Z7BN48_9LAMI|nr:hypothetical protein F511_10366 [Dorcoceras hygrometricum]
MDMFAEAFGLPTGGLVGFLDILTETVMEMQRNFSDTDVPFRAPNKKKEMKMEYILLHDIVAKALCAKAGSFDVVTNEKFYLMVAISAGLKSLSKKPEQEAGEMKKSEKATAEKKKKKKKETVVSWLCKCQWRLGAKQLGLGVHGVSSYREHYEETEDKNNQVGKETTGDQVGFHPGPIPDIPAVAEAVSTTADPKANMETTAEVEIQADDGSTTADPEAHFERQLDNKITGLESSLVRHFADSQQHLVDEIALLKSQVAEMVDCLKELRDAKKGERNKRRLL